MTEVTQTKKNDEIPRLSIEVLTKHNDKVDALKLVADSLAQQRQVASRILIFHPCCLAVLALFLSTGHYVIASSGRDDLGGFIITYGGVVLAYLITIRYFTGPYIHLTEEREWPQWLRGPDGVDDLILGARFGGDLIGALTLRLKRSGGKKSTRQRKAAIRAWTIRTRYRGKGLGSDMLLEAVVVTKKALGRDAGVEIAADHVNSPMFLHPIFNGEFLARDAKASKALSQAIGLWETK